MNWTSLDSNADFGHDYKQQSFSDQLSCRKLDYTFKCYSWLHGLEPFTVNDLVLSAKFIMLTL